jgi:DNA-binding MarR family transcriptional regulator
MELGNVDKEVLEIIKKGNGVQPSDILSVFDKKPQAISRSLRKLLKLDFVIATKGSDKRKIFYTARGDHDK